MGGRVQGHADPAFRAVRDVFEASFADGQNLGAGVAVYAGDRLVVDLWGGLADSGTGREWERETPCIAFSCTKAVTATAALRVADEYGVDLDAPVGEWWPEFACAGKEATTTAHLLSHRAGLPAFHRTVSAADAADAEAMAAVLAEQTPEWEPGTRHGYHAMTFGWLAGELVRRHTDSTVGEYTRRHLGADLHIGAPAAIREQAARSEYPPATQQVWSDPEPLDAVSFDAATVTRLIESFRDPQSMIMRGVGNPAGSFNDPQVQAGGWPAVGLITTARALAGFYRDLVRGKLLRPELLRHAVREQVRGVDTALQLESAFGLGFMLPSQNMMVPKAARATAFGHPGAGGSIGLGDIDNDLAIAFIPNLRRDWLARDRRAYRLIEAVYAAL
ncbi:serine hydrolase [Nocardia sp. SYP-A9097]|uniref:serine hydrolase domain-containing protein n=1 Tax=Nocardia sp. SYP-A9097 TaxID=2663237 RepID=UPI00129A3C48|nr:serine hydrolase domain-containing protein [Nocardia sp. SYP-A9097]MRH88992.1 serine hydrolase [Nocardia sp. SYP-A9097]